MTDVFLFILIFLLAYSNGANDISKGIATLVGSGTASIRQATIFGVITTALGSFAAIALGSVLLKVFSTGLLAEGIDATSIAPAVASGALLWVLLSSRLGMPVSTTHALVGGIIGAGLANLGFAGIIWGGLGAKVIVPLLISPFVSFGLAYGLLPVLKSRMTRSNNYCLCMEEREQSVVSSGTFAMSMPVFRIVEGEASACAQNENNLISLKVVDMLHFLSGGLTSFARGLNDAPKMAALLIGVSASTEHGVGLLYTIVGSGMLVGGLIGGRLVIDTLSLRITSINPIDGFVSNAVTSVLVTIGSIFGLPFSTTHVSAGSIVGIGAKAGDGVKWNVVRDILFAWLITLPTAALIAFTIQKILL